MEFPSELKYTQEHEWVRVEGEQATIGITDFAQRELGDIIYVEVETVDEELGQDDVFGTVEAVKTASDMYMPVSGQVLQFNDSIEDAPEKVNEDPYGDGWIIKIRLSDKSELDNLMDAEGYKKLVED